jgi:hypothetical protein
LAIQSQDLLNFLTQYKGGCNPLVIQLGLVDLATLPFIAMSFGSSDIVDVKIILQRDALANLLDYVSKTTHRLYASDGWCEGAIR